MNNNLGMQPNDFNNQNGAMQNQANNMQMNNQPMNNQPMNNVPVNNVAVNNVQPNNVHTGGYQEQSTQMNQQYNQGYSHQNMNVMNNDIGSQMLNTTATVVKHSSKTLILGGIFGVAVIAVSIVCVVLFLGKDRVSKQKSGDTIVSTPDSGLNSIPEFEYDKKGDFYMPIESVYTVYNKGTVIYGKIESGTVKVGDEIQILGIRNEIIKTKVVAIEFYRKQHDDAEAGEKVSLYLENVSMYDVERGQVAVKNDTVVSTSKFNAYIEMVSENNEISLNIGDKVSFNFSTVDINGHLAAFEGDIKEIKQGDKTDITVELAFPIALKEGTHFSIEIDGKIIGNGVVTEALSNETKLPNIEKEVEPTPNSGLSSIPEKTNNSNNDFFMFITDSYDLYERGVVVYGLVEKGSIKNGDEVQIVGGGIITAKALEVDVYRKEINSLNAGDKAYILLDSNVLIDDVERGKVLAKPNSIEAITKFHAYIEVDNEIFDKESNAQFNFYDIGITGKFISFESGFEKIKSGDKVDVTVELITSVALESGTKFNVEKNGSVIAKGVVTEVLE